MRECALKAVVAAVRLAEDAADKAEAFADLMAKPLEDEPKQMPKVKRGEVRREG